MRSSFLLAIFVGALFISTAEAFGSANLKSGVMNSISKMKHGMESMMEKMKKSVPQVPSLGGEAQASLAKQGEQMKNLENSAKQDIPIPTGLDEAQATEMTQTKEAAKDVKSELEGMTIPSMPAMTEEQEKSLATAEVDLKSIQNDMSAPIAAPIPTIPPEVTNALAAMAVDTKYFEGRPVPKISKPTATSASGAQSANALMQKTTIYKPRYSRPAAVSPRSQTRTTITTTKKSQPRGVADTTGTGGNPSSYSNGANIEVRRALQKASKRLAIPARRQQFVMAPPVYLSQPAPVYYPQAQPAKQFSPGAEIEIAKLRKQMKTLSQKLSSINSPTEEQKKQIEQQTQTNLKIHQLQHQINAVSAPVPKPANSEDSHAARMKVMSNLVSNLDSLGQAFGEDEMAEEDDFLAEKEDPIATILRSDLAAGVARVDNSLNTRTPLAYRTHTHLRHTGYAAAPRYPAPVNNVYLY